MRPTNGTHTPSQQASGHSGRGPAPPLPPRQIPDQPAYVPRAYYEPIQYQQVTGHVHNHGRLPFPERFPEAFPQGHNQFQARVPDSGQMPYRFGGVEPLYQPRAPSFIEDPSYEFGSPPPFDEAYPQFGNSSAWPPSTLAQQQQLYDERRYPDHLPQVPVSQPYSSRIGQKKALLIGINYTKHRDHKLRLKWCIHDVQEMARFLRGNIAPLKNLGFHPNNIRILTDDPHGQHNNLPTTARIVTAMHWLVEGAQPGDSLFLYFSGHATQIEDKDNDEPDGFDECLCATDYDGRSDPPTGIVVDDTMHDIMVKPLKPGCRLTAVFDCCHSGTLLDLPYIYDSQGLLKPTRQDIIQRKTSPAVVISLSACKDSGNAFETRGGGALREAFIEYMMRSGNRGTYLQAIQSVRAYMDNNRFAQRPQLSSSHWIVGFSSEAALALDLTSTF
ncbi:caspase domain-containing protein [Lactarius quietus]|nr:caspase domain-containing protein [Lactarius quietus]